MKSFTTLRTDYGNDTKNSGATNLTYGSTVMNDFHRRLLVAHDWPFLHRLRTMLTFAPTATITAAATDIITATDNTILTNTGTAVVFTTSDTLPAGLSTKTTFYMIYQTSTTFKVATSLANAFAGTAVDITDTGTGTHTVSVTTASQPLPYDVDLVESVFVTVNSTRYNPKPAPSRFFWDKLHYNTSTSDTPEYWFVQDGKFELWPRPSTDSNEITLNCKIRVPDLNIADYTTGTVDIITNGSLKVTGSSTVWTTPMVDRWIRITHSDTAASSGDGEWYRIAARESDTVITLDRPYGGRSLTTGAAAAYIIGNMPLLPEAFHDLPEFYGAFRYWAKEESFKRASAFKVMLDEGMVALKEAYGVNDLSMVVDDGEDRLLINPNLTVTI